MQVSAAEETTDVVLLANDPAAFAAKRQLDKLEVAGASREDVPRLVAKCGLDESVVVAIIQGRRTPSPEERDRVAAAFGLTRDQVSWGHKTPIQHIYGHGPG